MLKLKFSLLAILVTVLSYSPVFADTGCSSSDKTHASSAQTNSFVKSSFLKIDTDHDGMIDKAEFQSSKLSSYSILFEKYDSNANGMISSDEYFNTFYNSHGVVNEQGI